MPEVFGNLDLPALELRMTSVGIDSYSELAKRAGVHRNSLSPYLRGDRSVYSSVFVRLCETLDARPEDLIVDEEIVDQHGLFPMLKGLWEKRADDFSQYCCFLFGSRANNRASKFSDYDLGISGGISPVQVDLFLEIKEEILMLVDDLPVSVDIVDFDNAPQWFLLEVDDNFRYICGSNTTFEQLVGKLYGIKQTLKSS